MGNGNITLYARWKWPVRWLDNVESSGEITINGLTAEWDQGETGLLIPESINGKPVTAIKAPAFSTKNLTSVSLPGSVRSVEKGCFYNCNKLTVITVAAGNAYYSSINGVLFNKDKSVLVLYPPGNPNKSYTIPGFT